MIGIRLAVTAAAALLIFGAPSDAQTLRSVGGPAERPPASYTGKQYVDSRGCVFVRAGYGGAVTWVPRVSRSGKVVCNARPSRVAGSEPANPRTAAGEPPKQGLGTASQKPAPKPKRVVRTKPATKPVVASVPVAAPRVKTVTKPTPEPRRKVVVVRTPKPAPATAAPRVAGKPACDYGGTANQYVNSGARYPVRCGPQAESPNGNPVIGPRVVDRTQSSALEIPGPRPVVMPKGYKSTWDDGRLNPKRGIGTLSGAVATSLVWTNTVPRRLIDRRTGRDVTVKYAYLVYPYTDYARQKAELSAQGVQVQSVTVSTGYKTATRSSKTPVATTPVVPRKSTKTAPKAVVKPTYIRIGTFLDAAQKDRAVARLRSMGVPVKVGKVKVKGKPATVVVLGPFRSGTNLQSMLGRVRAAGFPAAKIRN